MNTDVYHRQRTIAGSEATLSHPRGSHDVDDVFPDEIELEDVLEDGGASRL